MIEYLPTLARGGHKKGEGEACVMEYVSIFAGERWSDSPSCTHPLIASVARSINDGYDDHSRPLLVDLIPRLVVANTELNTIRVHDHLVDWIQKWVQKTYGFHPLCSCGCGCNLHVLRADDAILIATKRGGVRFLKELLDEFDRYVEREQGTSREISPEQYRKADCAVHGTRYIPIPPPPQPAWVTKLKTMVGV